MKKVSDEKLVNEIFEAMKRVIMFHKVKLNQANRVLNKFNVRVRLNARRRKQK